jgi:hypothetical protein
MKLQLSKLQHRFSSLPDQLEVTLSIIWDDALPMEFGEITVAITHRDAKALPLSEIERLAINRANGLLN